MTRLPHILRAAVLLIGLLAMMVFAAPASAGRTWCARDPIVRIQGTELQILVAVPEELAPYVNGPVQVDIQTPDWATPELLFVDAGFNGHGEVVTFSSYPGTPSFDPTKTQVNVDVSVPIAYDQLPRNTLVPVQVILVPANGKAKTTGGNARGTSVGLTLRSTR
jgi:hypothetical protein